MMALHYHARGWSVVPLIGGTKHPAIPWRPYQTSRASRNEVRDWFVRQGHTAAGIIPGPVSQGLAVRDYDDEDAYTRWATSCPHLARTLPTVRTKRGYHLYFVGPPGYRDLEDGEYRADGKHYVVAPPSPLSGAAGNYTWIIPLPQGELPHIDPIETGLVRAPALDSEDTEDSEHPSVSSLDCIDLWGWDKTGDNLPYRGRVGAEADRLVRSTLPRRRGERHHRLSDFVWRLSRSARFRSASPTDLLPLLGYWWRLALPVIGTKDFAVSRGDWFAAWRRLENAHSAVETLWASAAQESPEKPLEAFLAALQRRVGDRPFSLDERTLAQLLGRDQKVAHRRLARLCREGRLVRVAAGSYRHASASEYRWRG